MRHIILDSPAGVGDKRGGNLDMKERERANILGCQVDLLTTQGAINLVTELIAQGRSAHVITLNAEIVYQAQSNKELLEIINAADLVTPDGIGIVWGGRHLGYPIAERITGIDLLHRLCQIAPTEAWKIYLLGSAPGVAEKAAQQLVSDYPGLQICGTQDGYFREADLAPIIQEIKNRGPQILFVALGAPKQELWIKKHLQQLGTTVCIGVGGSLDVIAGQKKRAPAWMIKLNLEWLYRLLAEPQRWKRQLVLPQFIVLILKSHRHGRL